jgi:hypothetical protein
MSCGEGGGGGGNVCHGVIENPGDMGELKGALKASKDAWSTRQQSENG